MDALCPEAVRWCAAGAILADAPAEEIADADDDIEEWGRVMVSHSAALHAYHRLYHLASEEMGPEGDTLADFNDFYSHRMVLGLFDKAIAAAPC